MDYDELCPFGWAPNVFGFCVAPNSYEGAPSVPFLWQSCLRVFVIGPCVRQKSFVDLNVLERASWGRVRVEFKVLRVLSGLVRSRLWGFMAC